MIGRFPEETSYLTMTWSVIDLVIVGARGIGLTPPDRQAIGILVAARSVPNTEERIAYLPAPAESLRHHRISSRSGKRPSRTSRSRSSRSSACPADRTEPRFGPSQTLTE